MARSRSNKFKGFALLEAIFGIALGVVIVMAFAALISQAQRLGAVTATSFQANLYLREAIEVARDLEQSNWAGLVTTCTAASPCHPRVTGGNKWALASGSEILDGKFTRFVVVSQVMRDQLAFPNSIVTSSGVTDPDTKKVSASVSYWGGAATRTISIDTYVYNQP